MVSNKLIIITGSILTIDNETPEYNTRSFVISISAYDRPIISPIQFSVTYFLKNTKR
jgi:hypothetical protein